MREELLVSPDLLPKENSNESRASYEKLTKEEITERFDKYISNYLKEHNDVIEPIGTIDNDCTLKEYLDHLEKLVLNKEVIRSEDGEMILNPEYPLNEHGLFLSMVTKIQEARDFFEERGFQDDQLDNTNLIWILVKVSS